MSITATGLHAFVGIFLSRQAATDLGRAQGALREHKGFEIIPRRLLHVTLDDLGPVPPVSLEAAALACERVVAAHPPFSLRSDRLEQFGSIAAVTFADPKGRLAALRAALHERLADYGFALDARRFVPHVALGRGALPSVLPPVPTVSLRVDRISLMQHVPADEPGLPWRTIWSGALPPVPQTDSRAALPDAERDAAIRAALDARLEARAADRAAVQRAQAAVPAPTTRNKRRRRRSGRNRS